VAVSEFKEAKIDAIARLHATEPVHGTNFTRQVRVIFGEFQRKVVQEVKLNGWDGKDGGDNDENAKAQWSFAGALLYAVTVITTIGLFHYYSSVVSIRALNFWRASLNRASANDGSVRHPHLDG